MKRLAIVGTGLMGGAVARAARARGVADEVVGIEPDPKHAELARSAGVVDHIADAVPDDADLVVLCCPSDRVPDWVQTLAEHPAPVCDVGSVKAPIVDRLRAMMGDRIPSRFVPCHPIAGSEKTGPAHAPSDLFNGRPVVLTPLPGTDAVALDTVQAFWLALGAERLTIDPEEHDRVLAVTSHLPHYLAYAFMLQVEEGDLELTGGGFSDFTRIAAANPEMWWRIFKLNREALTAALDGFEANVAKLREALDADDDAAGIALLQRAAKRRSQL